MHYRVFPSRPLNGEIQIPGDKSISHRALILAAIAEGQTTLHGFLKSADTLATVRALKAMSVPIQISEREAKAIVTGVGLKGLTAPQMTLDLGNSGTSMRLLTGLLSGQSFNASLTGDASLCRRPMSRLVNPLKQMNAKITTTPNGTAPIRIEGNGSLSGIHYALPVSSAQVKSGLLLAGLYAKGNTVIVEKRSTRDHTERLLRHFRYPIHINPPAIHISSGHRLMAKDIEIPGDLSSAAFFLVAATTVPNSVVTIRGAGTNPSRSGVITLLKRMGADLEIRNRPTKEAEEPMADIIVKYAPLRGISITPDDVPLAIDELPILLVAAASASGVTTLRGATELRVKESDRLEAMVSGLQRLGIRAKALTDGAIVEGGTIQGGEVDSLDDHRIAMAFAVAGHIANGPLTIRKCENVKTSFPNFVEVSRQLGMEIYEYDD